ncbi:peptidoglycan/LPS O-acetylase OafA/YrhL [Rhizobium sp. BK316]|uniref:acyltransferase family protein n=1 Tax=Rhizobium sp. BK316 TaxID=2587053 RepID=UPI001621BC5D|nr:peptidoglycan/LPS O-acetylase OafA/YrhL [Rhizobium sp. BK316]
MHIGIDDVVHNKNFSAWLDFFRWAAALEVVIYHINHRYFVKLFEVPHSERLIGHYLFAFISSFGGPAVILFFVMSGYLVGGSVAGRYLRSSKFDSVDYFITRLSRLWTVLIPALLFAFLFDTLALDIFHAAENGIFALDAEGAGTALNHDAWTAACNIAFLQTAFCTQFGSNGALWSLFHEFWYYMTFPLVMMAFWGRSGVIAKVAMTIAAAAILLALTWFQFVGFSIAGYAGIWLLGTFAALRSKPVLPINATFAAIGCIACLLVWRVLYTPGTATPATFFSKETVLDYTIAASFANLLMAMRQSKKLLRMPLPRLNEQLAGFSYSLYCTHTPLVILIGAICVWAFQTGWHMKPTENTDFLYAALAVAICVGFAFLFSLATERNTPAIRALFRRMRARKESLAYEQEAG